MAASLAGSSAAAAPLTFVYTGAGCSGLAALPRFEAFLGRKVDGVTDFADYSTTWANMVGETNWALGCWGGRGYQLSLAVPMMVRAYRSPTPLPDVARGRVDAYYLQLARVLIAHGFAGAYLRVGWEFNGGWYDWSAAGRTADWNAAYRRIVAVMRSAPGARFRFVWNPTLFVQKVWPSDAYPGDDVVDVIATDAYNAAWTTGYRSPVKRWNAIATGPWGLNVAAWFARKHGKPLALPEWGTGVRPDGHGGGDDPLFIADMALFMSSNDVAYQAYWDYPAPDYNARLSNGQYPRAGQAFQAAFGTKRGRP